MRNFFFTISLIAALIATAADNEIYYGFAPQNPAASDITAHGTGMNKFIEGAICLNPQSDPMLQHLIGQQILGVRAYLRDEYHQASKGFSGIWLREESLEAQPYMQYADFDAGWNSVYFDSPIELGPQPLYLGVKVLEKKGTPYPLVSYAKASVNDGCYISMDQNPFVEYQSRGTLLIEAIISAPEDEMTHYALAQISDIPQVVMPQTAFNCSLYVRNQGAQPITELSIATTSDDGTSAYTYDVPMSDPIEGYDGRLIPFTLVSPSTEGDNVPLTIEVSAINGMDLDGAKPNTSWMMISEDAFVHIPLVEEFTSLYCVNCPFMIYYLDRALEAFGPNHVYVAHHAGFADDAWTLPQDQELLYLFGSAGTFNPAAMIDRRLLDGNPTPIISAREPSIDPYMAYLQEAWSFPAMAKVLVDIEIVDDQAVCTVHGRIAKAMLDKSDALRVSAYLVENGIEAKGDYRQSGVSYDVADDAPSDLVETFRHNGVIRICFSTSGFGDKLDIDSDGNFSLTFPPAQIAPSWILDNCQAVADVHMLDLDNIANNTVLNAGASHLNAVAEGAGVDKITADTCPQVYVDASGRIRCTDPTARLCVYDMRGASVGERITKGIYLVRVMQADGTVSSVKIVR